MAASFRLSLQRLGLLRKRKDRLLLTRAGAAARRDPAALWEHLGARLAPAPTGAAPTFAETSTLLILLHVATGEDAPVPVDRLAAMLGELGWGGRAGSPSTATICATSRTARSTCSTTSTPCRPTGARAR